MKVKDFIWQLQQHDPEALVYKTDYAFPGVINRVGNGRRMDLLADIRKKLKDDTIDNVVLI